jgi:polysaccharide export outer membrane protein
MTKKGRALLPSFLNLALSFIFLACSTTTYIKWDEETYQDALKKFENNTVVIQTTPSKMTPEQKKPLNPLHRSPYLIKKIEKIPVLSPREEVLEGREEYYLGYHDILRITVFGRQDPVKGVSDIVRDTEIRDDGKISYPLIGDIWAVGLTIPELQRNIVEKLKEYIAVPKVDIQIIKYGSRDVSILGEVREPQIIYLRGKTTLLEAIAQAGGLTENANLKGSYVIRKNKIIPIDLYALMIEGDLKYNIELKRKDVVYIPNVQDQRVYVVGEVNSPGIVPFAGKILTLAEAIASAGDFKISAKKRNVKIIRGGLENPTIITVDFNKITKGDLTENIALHSEDIVFVPASLVGEWNKILEQITPSLQTIMFGATLKGLTD